MRIKFWIVVLFVFLAAFAGTLIGATVAKAAPGNCTFQNPYPSYNSVCNGYGQQCYLAFDNCTTVKGMPGTWNPGGYTPCTYMNGCGMG